jgi:glycosyltransferase involved in cell wall biosynthesis
MVFRYANACAAIGWQVTVVMPAGRRNMPGWAKVLSRGRYWWWRLTRGYAPTSWMKLDPRVQLAWVRDLTPARAVVGDVVVATAVETAEAVARWPDSAGRKFYFIQGYETWDHPPTRVEASWRLPLTKFAVSRWLCELVAAAGQHAHHLPNGLDPEAFGLDCPIKDRDSVILWPHHSLAGKGSGDVQMALSCLPTEFRQLRIRAFGTCPRPSLPRKRFEYFRDPPQKELRRLYNEAMVFVAPSHSEGWGLPACEALQCGCALAATDIGGHREFLKHGFNALLHVPGDLDGLSGNIVRLLREESLRWRLAQQGLVDMQALRFDVAAAKLRELLAGNMRP